MHDVDVRLVLIVNLIQNQLVLKRLRFMGLCCNTPDVTFHICNSDSCHFRLCVMIFPSWLGFVFRFAFCSCHASHIMSSCALHLHTCSSYASEHFPRYPFCDPTLPRAPAHPSCFFSWAGVKTVPEWTEVCQVALVYHRETTGQVSFHLEVVWYSNG